MKKTLSVLLAAVLILSLGVSAFAAEETKIFFDSSSETLRIVVPDSASESVSFAAETLSGYIGRITGFTPEVSPAAAALPAVESEKVIWLSDAISISSAKVGSYGLIWLETDPSTFIIEGLGARGVINGVYAFLRELCGVNIYSADVKTVPESATISAPYPYAHRHNPTLEYADTDWISPHDLEFALANGLNGTYSPLETVHGGKVKYIWFCHSLTGGIVPQNELFESHPEYYALTERAGKREATQLCLSNPEVVERAKKDVLDALEREYDPDAALNIVSVTQADNQNYCVCENCSAIAEQYGGQSGLMIWFVNQIADAVRPDYPDVVVDTFAYQYTRHAPTGIKPRDNVCVRLCTIECCFAHTLDDPDCRINVELMKDLSDWSNLTKRLYVWDYVTNFVKTLCFFPNFGVIRQNINTFRENSVVGIYEEGAYYASQCDSELYDLRAYLLARDMEDVLTEEDQEELTRGFCEAYYGAGAEEMLELLSFLTEHAGNDEGHLQIYYGMADSLHGVTEDDVKKVDALFASAYEKTADAPDAAARIKKAELSWRYYKASARTGEFKSFLGISDYAENKKLYEDTLAMGITRFSEGAVFSDVKPSFFTTPDDWFGGDSKDWVPAATIPQLSVLAVLVLFAFVLGLIKKKPAYSFAALVLLPVAVFTGAWSGRLFVDWDNLPLYSLADACMLLTVAAYCFTAACAKNGFAVPKGKKLALSVFLSLLIAALPYELIVLLINTIIHHGLRPVFSITVSSYCQILVICACLVTVIVSLFRIKRGGKKEQ
ncbi:MAG: DUF4838 domain-containing protein [Clostridia bacterium]|nr:DUF4838 domain-containing protein [Clostridia bacterium]